MLGNKIIPHLLVTFLYFLSISLLRLEVNINLLWLWLGAFSGSFLLDLDHFLYWFFTHPEELDSQQAKVLLRTKNYKGLYHQLVLSRGLHKRLIFHSALFQIILFPLSFFILSSGGSIFASGLVMSINLHLLKDEWQDFFKNREKLSDWLFWQVKGLAVREYLKIYMVVVTAVFAGLTLLLI